MGPQPLSSSILHIALQYSPFFICFMFFSQSLSLLPTSYLLPN
jgi:hypothetical protein